MAKKDLLAYFWELFTPIVTGCGLELYDVEYVKEGQNWYIRAFIDKEGGVTISDCELVNKKLDKLLDEKDPVQHPYILEVSSPGLDRALKKEADFIKYMGSVVQVKLYKAKNGQKLYEGELAGFHDGIIKINNSKAGEMEFNIADVASCKLAVIL